MTRFELHWGEVPAAQWPGPLVPGATGLALWPAPVNPDACFEAAGFTDFGAADPAWESEAEAWLDRLLALLAQDGPPALQGPAPLMQPAERSWWRQAWRALATGWLRRAPESVLVADPVSVLPLSTQLWECLHWDGLPPCEVAFGRAGTRLQARDGHLLAWVALAPDSTWTPEALVQAAAGEAPLHQTPLQWTALWGAAPAA
ncbi:hypothetical protein [Ideonella livida]|uniref:Uncharacterized protein n=1 Tax=Ideonella livida TaxID=2707176 RepID=A0A7C9TK68_9BURK|nr:hypothetical protein [Ideonella livida]NDY92501.1 hypothetical protein [Ideonella livida]